MPPLRLSISPKDSRSLSPYDFRVSDHRWQNSLPVGLGLAVIPRLKTFLHRIVPSPNIDGAGPCIRPNTHMENAYMYARTPGTGAEQMDSYTPIGRLSRSPKRDKLCVSD